MDRDYTISNVFICKTDVNGKIYEIEEFDDYEYVVLYHEWDGVIYRKVAEVAYCTEKNRNFFCK